MKTKLFYSKVAAETRLPARLSLFISHLAGLKPGPVVLYLRVSRPHQTPHLQHQLESLTSELKKRGFKVVAVFQETCSGREINRSVLWDAAWTAREQNAVLVAESVDRFQRSWLSDKKDAWLSVNEMRRLQLESCGVRLVTFLDPDLSPRKVRGYQSRRGQIGSGNSGGRPKETPKRRRLRLRSQAIRMRSRGLSLTQISKTLNVQRSTLQGWFAGLKLVQQSPTGKSRFQLLGTA